MHVCQVIQDAAGQLIAQCPDETLWELLTDPNHWALEVIIMVVFDGLVGALLWPFVRRWWSKHHDHNTCDPKLDDTYPDDGIPF